GAWGGSVDGSCRTIGQARPGRQGRRGNDKFFDPPSQIRAPRAQCAPRQGAVGASRQGLAEEDEKSASQGVDVLRNRARMCGSPDGKASGPEHQEDAKNRHRKVLTDAKTALSWAAR